jgi:hypothetical protein
MTKPAYKKAGSEYSGVANEKLMKAQPSTSEAYRNSHGGKPKPKKVK